MFDTALGRERDLGIDFWDGECPRIDEVDFTIVGPEHTRALAWAARLDAPAMSVDQRVKVPRWLERVLAPRRRGADPERRLRRARAWQRVRARRRGRGQGRGRGAVRAGRGRSPFSQPMRALGLTYVRARARARSAAICFNVIPGVGEYFVFPALTTSGPARSWSSKVWSAGRWTAGPTCGHRSTSGSGSGSSDASCPGSTRVRARRAHGPERHPRRAFRAAVRKPVARLPSGRPMLGMADVVCLNDPITGKGRTTPAKCAAAYLHAILEARSRVRCRWMTATFESYWSTRASSRLDQQDVAATGAARAGAAERGRARPRVARWFANAFDDPRRYFPQFTDPAAAHVSSMTRPEKTPYDVVIVGSGINSLVCAALLARRGRKVCVLERNDVAGGCIRTEELTQPGFRHDTLSTLYPLFVRRPTSRSCRTSSHVTEPAF